MHLYFFSCFFLAATSAICVLGCVSPRFDENIFQNVGMFMLAVGCGSRIPDLWQSEVPLDWFLLHAGMGLFAIGTAFKVWMRDRAARLRDYVHSIWRPQPTLAHAHSVPDEER